MYRDEFAKYPGHKVDFLSSFADCFQIYSTLLFVYGPNCKLHPKNHQHSDFGISIRQDQGLDLESTILELSSLLFPQIGKY